MSQFVSGGRRVGHRWTTKMKHATNELSLMPMMVSKAKAASCTTENSMMLMSPVKAVM